MAYTKKSTLDALEKAVRAPSRLYKSSCINWSGTVSGMKGVYYTEIIAQKLLENDLFKSMAQNIAMVPRKDYTMHSHQISGHTKGTSNREEELFAKIVNGTTIGELGAIIDYQIPLKASHKNTGVGKIDLVSLNKTNAYIIELKYADNTETLLRAVLEIWTYYHQLNKEAFTQSFGEKGTLKKIKKAVLLVIGCKAYYEAKDLQSPKRKHLRDLLRRLDVQVFLLDNLTKII